MDEERHIKYMREALDEARAAAARGEVPIGAVLVNRATGTIVARDGNRTIERADPTAHAEVNVIRTACAAAGSQRIPGHDLYVTLEPCALCAAAASFARIDHVIYGASDEKGGGVAHGGKFYEQPTCHHRPMVTAGVMDHEGGILLKEFFAARRKAPAS